MTSKRLSFVIPARNEEALISEVVIAILASISAAMNIPVSELKLADTPFEVIVSDDGSEDNTPHIVQEHALRSEVRLVQCFGRSCAAARNTGAVASSGTIVCFVDADTIVPIDAAGRILLHHEREQRCLVLYRLASREPGVRAWAWWTFWGLARRLPLARAKSMPAFMSISRTFFDRYGPFQESRLIAEEWPLTGAAYRDHPEHFLYDRKLTARTSSRRMELQSFGYARTFFKWVAVVLFPWARTSLNDRIRHSAAKV